MLKQRMWGWESEESSCPSSGLQLGLGCFKHPQMLLSAADIALLMSSVLGLGYLARENAFFLMSTLIKALPQFQLQSQDGP